MEQRSYHIFLRVFLNMFTFTIVLFQPIQITTQAVKSGSVVKEWRWRGPNCMRSTSRKGKLLVLRRWVNSRDRRYRRPKLISPFKLWQWNMWFCNTILVYLQIPNIWNSIMKVLNSINEDCPRKIEGTEAWKAET